MNIFKKRRLKKKLERYETLLAHLIETRDAIVNEGGEEPLGHDQLVSKTKDYIYELKNILGIYEI